MDNALFHVGVTADLWRIRLVVAAGSLQPLVPDNIQFPALKKNRVMNWFLLFHNCHSFLIRRVHTECGMKPFLSFVSHVETKEEQSGMLFTQRTVPL